MLILSVLLLAVAAVMVLPVVSDGLSGLRAGPRDGTRRRQELSRFLILVPAHDEELLIARCLRSLQGLDYPASHLRIVVIADNCSDATPDIARAAGVECLERSDLSLAGKPWAINWALQRLPLELHDAVVIVDADSVLDPGFARAYAAAGPLADKALQCYNDVDNRTEGALTRMAFVFSAVRFRFMNAVKARARLNVPLGNGLCIGTNVLRRHGWQAFSICEDWEMYAILTQLGIPIESAIGARIYSQEAKSLKQSGRQRQRWTAGKFVVLRERWRAILSSSAIGAAQKLDAIAELTSIGPAVHAGVVLLLTAAAAVADTPVAWAAVVLAWLSVARIAAYTILAIRLDPEPRRALVAFVGLPLYMVWRVGLQCLAMVGGGRIAWHRTARHHETGLESAR